MNTTAPQTTFQRATSRKLWVAIGTLATVLTGVELTDRQAIVIVAVAIAYIIAEAAVDWQRARHGVTIETPAEPQEMPTKLVTDPSGSIERRARALLAQPPSQEHLESVRELLSVIESLRADAVTEANTSRGGQ